MYKTTLLVVNVIFEGHGRIIIKESCKSFNLQDSLAEREALEPTHSRNIIKLQITDNHIQSGVHSKSKSF